MKLRNRVARYGAPHLMVLGALIASPCVGAQSPALSAKDRAQLESIRRQSTPTVGVEDLIGMTTFGSASVQGSADHFNLAFSPDRKHVAVVIQRGNVPRNTRDFSLLVFQTEDLLKQSNPVTVAQLSTNSNRSAIAKMRWLDDNATITFLGEQPNQHSQVYAVNIHTRELKQLTQAKTNIEAFAVTGSGDTVVYLADEPKPNPKHYERMRERGFAVSAEVPLFNLIAGDWLKVSGNRPQAVHVVREGGDTRIPIPLEFATPFKGCEGGIMEDVAGFSLIISPDGGSALVRCRFIGGALASWSDYQVETYTSKTTMDVMESWQVVDLRSGKSRSLTRTPAVSLTPPKWLADGRRVRLFNEVLPLEGVDESTRKARMTQTFDANVDTQTGEISAIVVHKAAEEAPAQAVQLEIQQGLNQPWVLVAKDSAKKKQRTVYDPNPSLMRIRRFAHVTPAQWRTKSGAEYQGAIYWPTDYVAGRRYPLVFQTRGVQMDEFLPNGLSTTGHAAQPLAGSGIVVLQGMTCVKNCEDSMKTPERSYPRYQENVEGGIDELDRLGLIDRTKVGIQGWSMSCMHVMQMLTKSTYPIAAANGSDCRTDDYMIHLAQAPLWRANTDWFARMKGGQPFGEGLKEWVERAPGFNLHKVKAPLLLEALGPEWFQGVLSEWEFYAGLVLQNKPVEMIYLPDAQHSIVKPLERVTSQQTAIDWYRFWLQGYERKEPIAAAQETVEELTAQYQRWHRLREQQKISAGIAQN